MINQIVSCATNVQELYNFKSNTIVKWVHDSNSAWLIIMSSYVKQNLTTVCQYLYISNKLVMYSCHILPP